MIQKQTHVNMESDNNIYLLNIRTLSMNQFFGNKHDRQFDDSNANDPNGCLAWLPDYKWTVVLNCKDVILITTQSNYEHWTGTWLKKRCPS